MATRKLDKTEWHWFFDRISKGLAGARAEIEVISPTLGNQIEAEWKPLIGITYDPKDGILEVAVDGLDHMIQKPRVIYAEESGGLLTSLEVIDADKISHLIRLREGLFLPGPTMPAG
jgi:Family of unknown function (DUF5335)